MVLCEVCQSAEAKYTCPACARRTCSLACVKEHKERTECSGVRPKTTFIPIHKMSDETMTEDVFLLEEIRGKVSNSPAQPQHSVSQACKKRIKQAGVKVRWLPGQFERARSNGTSLVDGQIVWQVEIRTCDGSFDPNLPETWPTVKGTLDLMAESSVIDAPCFLLEEPEGQARRLKSVAAGTKLSEALCKAEIIEYPILMK